MTAAAAVSTSNSASPIVHAVGGSIGSALALLLFYPLERARIELQSRASQQVEDDKEGGSNETQEDLLNSVEIEVNFDDPTREPSSTRHSSSEDHGDTVSTSSSWIPIPQDAHHMRAERSDSGRNIGLSPSLDVENDFVVTHETTDTPRQESSSQEKGVRQRGRPINSDMIQCLMDLHSRGTLYQGVTPVMTTIFASQFVFFFLHAYIKGLLQKSSFFRGPKKGWATSDAILSLISSCIAGIGNVLLTNPLWVANMAIVTGEAKSSSLIREVMCILRAKGYGHLWNGTAASILLVSNPVIQFFTYEQLKMSRLAYGMRDPTAMGATTTRTTLPPLEAFVAGAISKTIATVATYPLQLTQTILRLENHGYHGIVDCLIKLYRRAGYQEWYTGIKAKLLQTVLNASFTFLTYEQIVRAVQLALVRSTGLPDVV